jgi:ribosomal subunit interface protein
VEVHFKDLPTDPELREALERRVASRCDELLREFEEITRCEIHLAADGVGFTAQAHATAKGVDTATHAEASELGPAADQALDRLERQLRKLHDKRIFSQRREAQRDPPKRKPASPR